MSNKLPERLRLGDNYYKVQVLLVVGKVNDKPSLLRVIEKDHVVNLAGGEEFIIGYLYDKPVVG